MRTRTGVSRGKSGTMNLVLKWEKKGGLKQIPGPEFRLKKEVLQMA